MFALRRSEALCVKEKEEAEGESIGDSGSSMRSLRRGFSRKLRLQPHNILIYLQSPDSPNSYISSPRYSTEPQSSPDSDSDSERGSRRFSIFKMPTATNSPTIQVVQEPPKTPSKTRNRDTGFPEPFNTERNTTLTHPDADTSEDASIEGPEIAVSRTHSRKISFLSHRSKGSHNSGKIDPSVFEKLDSSEGNGEAGLYDDIQYSNGRKKKKNGLLGAELMRNGDEDTNGEVRSERDSDDQGSIEGERKKGVLRKLHLHQVLGG